MELIQNNPFRIAGILSNATEREIEKQKGRLKAFLKVGKSVSSEFDFDFLSVVERSEDIVNRAFSTIQQNQDRVHHAMFWFINANPFDNTAIEYLKNGDQDKALEIWEKVTAGKEVNAKNYSSFSNIGTYKLLSQSKGLIREGIEAKFKLIGSDYFEHFIRQIADETYSIDSINLGKELVNELMAQFKLVFKPDEILYLFESCDESVKQVVAERFTEEPMYNIESQIDSCKKKRKANKSNAYKLGKSLNAKTKKDLSLLKTTLGLHDIKYKSIADQLANEIMQCGIDYFNESQENGSKEDYLIQAQELNNVALNIAVGKLVEDRARDHIATLEEMKDNLLLEANALLQSVKEAFESNERDIRQHIAELKKNDPEIKLGLKSINYSVVEDNIKNSINWDKVNELLKEVLPINNLEKIKFSSNDDLKFEFVELINWLHEHSQKKTLIKGILDAYRKIPPKLPISIVSSEITNTDNNPLYTKYVRYIGIDLKIQVQNVCDFRVYMKYIKPNGQLKRNEELSPNGYTRVESFNLDKNVTGISFSGWGNADKCTYETGEHRIELYVDEYLIHSKKFKIEIAPSEKIQKNLTDAVKILSDLKQTEYFEDDIRKAKRKMNEIKEFHLFRMPAERERQINEQRSKINQLIENADRKKRAAIKSQEETINKLKTELSLAKY